MTRGATDTEMVTVPRETAPNAPCVAACAGADRFSPPVSSKSKAKRWAQAAPRRVRQARSGMLPLLMPLSLAAPAAALPGLLRPPHAAITCTSSIALSSRVLFGDSAVTSPYRPDRGLGQHIPRLVTPVSHRRWKRTRPVLQSAWLPRHA